MYIYIEQYEHMFNISSSNPIKTTDSLKFYPGITPTTVIIDSGGERKPRGRKKLRLYMLNSRREREKKKCIYTSREKKNLVEIRLYFSDCFFHLYHLHGRSCR